MNFTCYLYTVISLLFFFVIGHVVFYLLKTKHSENYHYNLFAKLATGLFLFVAAYSIIKTNGRTINVGFILISGALFYLLKKEKLCGISSDTGSLFKFNSKNTLLLVFELTVISLWWYIFQTYSFDKAGYNHLNPDVVFYSKITEYLNTTGHENYLNMYSEFGYYNGTAPYHYFELWLCAASSFFFHSLTYTSYLTILVPTLLTIISIGLIALFKSYFKTNYFNLLLPILLLFHTRIIPFSSDPEVFGTDPLANTKVLPLYIAMIASFLLLRKNIPIALIVLSSCILINSSALIGITGGITCLLLYTLLFGNQSNKSEFRFVAFYIPTLLCFVAAFYFITGTNQTSTFLNNHLSLYSLKTPIHIIIKSIADIVSLFYIYFIVTIFYLFKTHSIKKHSQLFIITLGSIASSLFAWAIFYPVMDSAQLFVIPAISIIHICIIVLFISFLWQLRGNMKYQIPLVLLMIIGVTESFINAGKALQSYTLPKYSVPYITSIRGFTETNSKNPTGIYIKGKDDYQTIFEKNPSFSVLGDYLKLMKPEYNTVCLSVFDTPLDSLNQIDYNREQVFIKSSVFWKFVEAQKESGKFTSISQSQIDFIKTYHIQYGIISKNAIVGPEMKAIIIQTLTDSVSGERFVLFGNI